ncbi:MAG: hypothetical protein WCE40_22445 [Polyangia bacterium]
MLDPECRGRQDAGVLTHEEIVDLGVAKEGFQKGVDVLPSLPADLPGRSLLQTLHQLRDVPRPDGVQLHVAQEGEHVIAQLPLVACPVNHSPFPPPW